MRILLQNAYALSGRLGRTTFFITVTCNPKWPEIVRELLPGLFACLADVQPPTCGTFSDELRVDNHAQKSRSAGGDIGNPEAFACIGGLFYELHIPTSDMNPFNHGWGVNLVVAPSVDALAGCAQRADGP
jgi:hypothetical protein